ncbi:hypothetical protein MANES_14G036650v8 [Manihot esculenta]|uniref:Uncharacterized protein n=1 Tax=Manihot esculenta TaxID=3983 RepID=A0ACB7GE39_MANES|nr:hypothetical protein MANES_14G036650v8 [Manihot esculenta]
MATNKIMFLWQVFLIFMVLLASAMGVRDLLQSSKPHVTVKAMDKPWGNNYRAKPPPAAH